MGTRIGASNLFTNTKQGKENFLCSWQKTRPIPCGIERLTAYIKIFTPLLLLCRACVLATPADDTIHSVHVVGVVRLSNHALLLCLHTTPNDGVMLLGNIRKAENYPGFFYNFINQINKMSVARPLSNIQQELLKLYSSDIGEADLLHIKRYLASYFADKAIKEADKIWDANGYTNDTMKQWLNEDQSRYCKF